MKIKLGEVTMIQQGLMTLVNQQLPVKLSYKLGKLIKIVDDEVQEIENKRIELVKKYGVKNEEDNTIKVPDDKQDGFMQEYTDLLNLEIDVTFEPISISELPDDLKITPQQLIYLENVVLKD